MTFLTIGAINKDMKIKKKNADNHFHNIFRLFDALRNFSFTTSDISNKHGMYELPHKLPILGS